MIIVIFENSFLHFLYRSVFGLNSLVINSIDLFDSPGGPCSRMVFLHHQQRHNCLNSTVLNCVTVIDSTRHTCWHWQFGI